MVYRPTVRYDDAFKGYVDDLFHATTLDRNQIMRAALFSAAFSFSFHNLMKQYKKSDVPLPLPKWEAHEHGYWKEKEPIKNEGGKDVYANIPGRGQTEGTIRDTRKENDKQREQRNKPIERRERKVQSERIQLRDSGGITIKIG